MEKIFSVVEILSSSEFSVDVCILDEYKHKSSAKKRLARLEKDFPDSRFEIMEIHIGE